VITNSLADILKAEVGSELILISQGADGSIANDRFIVSGILLKDLDSLENNTVFMLLIRCRIILHLKAEFMKFQ
jgi:putative ABC transport system permease protein